MPDRARNRWLSAAVERLRPWFVELGKPLPAALHVEPSFERVPPEAFGLHPAGFCSPPDANGVVWICIGPHLLHRSNTAAERGTGG